MHVPVNIYVNLSLLNRKLCNSSTSLFLKQKSIKNEFTTHLPVSANTIYFSSIFNTCPVPAEQEEKAFKSKTNPTISCP